MTKEVLRRFAAVIFLILATIVPIAAVGPAASAAGFDTAPAAASVLRLLPTHANQISLVAIDQQTAGVDRYTVSGPAGAIQVQGTSPATLLAGVGWYLRNVARVDIGFPGDSSSRLPGTLPAVATPFTNSAVVPHRYALNDTDHGYSGPYRTFSDYQRQVDVLALHGFNELYITVGAEKAYYAALQQFGYTAAEARAWIPTPAHQPWWLLQNMFGMNGPVSEQLINSRATLGRQIADHMRALGMTPVLPGYFGTVPTDFASRNPGTNVVAQGTWVGFTRPSWLDPTSTTFAQFAAAYYASQTTTMGVTTRYKMDPLFEGGQPGNINVTAAGTAIQQALLAAHPGAIWVLLGWQSAPSSQLIAGMDKPKAFIIDGVADRYDHNRETDWSGTTYAFGTIPNYGGKTTLGANTGMWSARFQQRLTKSGSALKGIAYIPEGTGTDPAALTFFADLAWSPSGINQTTWFQNYATTRYGGVDSHAAAAWGYLRQGPYNTPTGSWAEPHDSLFTARPSLTASTSATWSPTSMRYTSASIRGALNELLQVAPALRSSDAYKFDLVDLTRQAVANRSRELLPQINAAYGARDLTKFRSLVTQWGAAEDDLERILATDTRFMVGTWLSKVTPWGVDTAERNQLQYDARSILTTWGSTVGQADSGGLRDYAAREWSGMISGLYSKRWDAFFAAHDTALVNNTTPASVNYFTMDNAWARATTTYPTTTTGDFHAIATSIAASLPTVPTWISLGGVLVDSPAVASQAAGQLPVFVRGANNGLWRRTWNGTSWTAYASLSGPTGGTLVGTPAVASSATGRLDLVVRGNDNALWTISGTPAELTG